MAIINVNGIDLYYERHGKGEPLVLLSGFTSDHTAWSGLLSRLIKHYHVILVDNRGAGQSSCPDYPYTIDMMADDVVALCQALALANVHFIGSSMGGCIVQSLAWRYPQLVASAVIANAFMKMDARRRLFYKNQYEMLEANVSMTSIIKDRLCWVYSNHYLDKPGRVERLVQQWQQSKYPFTLTGYRHQIAALSAFDSSPWLANITRPCLVMGCDEDLMVLASTTREMAQRIEGASYVCLENSGHLPYLERPQAFLRVVTDFIKGVK